MSSLTPMYAIHVYITIYAAISTLDYANLSILALLKLFEGSVDASDSIV